MNNHRTLSPVHRVAAEVGAVSAEYATVTACGVGLGGILLKLLTSEWGQSMLKTIFDFFLKMLGIG
jgi:hypothetical protein